MEVKLWSFESEAEWRTTKLGAKIQTTIISFQFTGQFTFNQKNIHPNCHCFSLGNLIEMDSNKRTII